MSDIQIEQGSLFTKSLKKYQKKYRSLNQDMAGLLKVITKVPKGNKSKHWVTLKQVDQKFVFKTRLMCRSLKGASFRVIYYYDGKKLELIFLEMYFKGDKESENKVLVQKFWDEKTKLD